MAAGSLGALILIAAYFVGVALIGAGIGAGAASVIWASFGREPGIIPVIVLAILGALGALALQRYVIIVATAFAGAQTTVVGAAALMGNRAAADAVARSVYRVYPLDPLPGDAMGSRGLDRPRDRRARRAARDHGEGEEVSVLLNPVFWSCEFM